MGTLAIVGGNIQALITSAVFESFGWRTLFFSDGLGSMGGEFLRGSLKHIGETPGTIGLMHRLEIPTSSYVVQGGMHLHGIPVKFPQCMGEMTPEEAMRVHQDFNRKVFKTSLRGGQGCNALVDVAARTRRRALRCDNEELVAKLSSLVLRHVSQPVVRVFPERRTLCADKMHRFDAMVLTSSRWTNESIFGLYGPLDHPVRTHFVNVTPRRDDYAGFDYVYTPYTPNGSIHCLTPREGDYCVEINGEVDRVHLHADLQFLFPEGYAVTPGAYSAPGHIDEDIEPNSHGSFGQISHLASVDHALDIATNLAKKWDAKRA